MDERKIVKVIDEHDIDRTANVMCSIDVDGSDYVIYSIKRDEENDNLFVSKLIKNNDGTSSMVNIEDNIEKSKLVDIVKELITFSINSEADKTSGSVNLSSGKEIKISSVLINKEQNINVSKTYITTVKRSVTKVGNNFYSVELPNNEPVVESIFDSSSSSVDVFPEASVDSEMTSIPEEVIEPVLPEIPNIVIPEAPIDSVSVNDSNDFFNKAMPEEVSTVSSVVDNKVPEVNEFVISDQDLQSKTTFIGDGVAPTTNQEAVVSPSTDAVNPVPTPVVNTSSDSSKDNKLVFDGSKETNLNVALGEVSKDNIIPVEDVTSIREFGQDEVAVGSSTDNSAPMASPEKAGFANNKFFMVVAIAFFLAACVFLGYEVFKYFKMVG